MRKKLLLWFSKLTVFETFGEFVYMPLYENVVITRQDLSLQDVEKLSENFAAIIKEGNGKIVKLEQWGLRDLAYPIKKSAKGYYTLFGIDAPFEAVKELNRKLKLNEDVLRSMTFRVDAIDTKPSAIIAPEAEIEEASE